MIKVIINMQYDGFIVLKNVSQTTKGDIIVKTSEAKVVSMFSTLRVAV